MFRRTHFHEKLILSPGTQVVILIDACDSVGNCQHPKGSVGVVVRSPTSEVPSYRIRFMDMYEDNFEPNQVVLLAKFKEDAASGESNQHLDRDDLYQYVIYRCVVGSRAYGLDTEESDIDYRGIYLPPADVHWSLLGVPEQLECFETQEAYWELEKFLTLALKANPNILESLYTPLVELTTPIAEELLAMREAFLSKLLYQTFNGYVSSQFKKMQKDIENHGSVKWKHVMHLIRLLLSGITALKERTVPVQIDQHRDVLLSIKRGEVPWEEVEPWRVQLHKDFDTAFQTSSLPDLPDFARANEFLIRARRSMVGRSG